MPRDLVDGYLSSSTTVITTYKTQPIRLSPSTDANNTWRCNEVSMSKGRYGCHSTNRHNELVPQVHDLVQNERRLTICEMAQEVGISYGSCQAILADHLEVRCV
jgi:hypothetical protein